MTVTASNDSFTYKSPRGDTERPADLVGVLGADGGAIVSRGAVLTPLLYAQDTTISSASALPGTIPAATTVALIQAEGADIRWRDDGENPTASVGMLLGAGTAFWYRGTFSAFKAIQVTSGGILNVSYYQEVAE